MQRHAPAPSIQRRLLLLLLAPVATLLLAGALIDYFTGLGPLNRAYDQALSDATLAVANRLRVDASNGLSADLSDQAIAMLRADSADAIYFEVVGPNGAHIVGDPGLPAAEGGDGLATFGDGYYKAAPIRLCTYRVATPAGVVRVTVAETRHKRQRERGQILSAIIAVDLVQLVCILVLVWWAVRHGLQPFQRLRQQIAQRSARDLSPLDTQAVPLEVSSLVQALNRLFTAVRHSGEAQQAFLASAAHQLRTPLTGMQAQLGLLSSDHGALAIRDRLQALHVSSQRMTRTTNQLLALARADPTVNLHRDFALVNLKAVVETAVSTYLERAIAANIDLGVELAPASTIGIEWMLHELLSNLLDNALIYAPRGGIVTVRCGVHDGRPALEVEDNGPGISPTERLRVTERFYRAANARGNGSGLGLAIVDEICIVHGAQLAITPAVDGAGTRVTILFAATA